MGKKGKERERKENKGMENGNPVYLGVPLLFRRLLKKGGLLLPCQHYVCCLSLFASTKPTDRLRITRSICVPADHIGRRIEAGVRRAAHTCRSVKDARNNLATFPNYIGSSFFWPFSGIHNHFLDQFWNAQKVPIRFSLTIARFWPQIMLATQL